jgi:hypothetical protein
LYLLSSFWWGATNGIGKTKENDENLLNPAVKVYKKFR